MAFDPERLQILDAFHMPQLARERAIRLYLPRDYHTTLRRYPVIYMQDGQNVFDDATASYGRSWRVGETLDALHEQSDRARLWSPSIMERGYVALTNTRRGKWMRSLRCRAR